MTLVYIASPFSGDTEKHTKMAQDYCRRALEYHCVPFAPHLHYPQFMNDDNAIERALGLKFALLLLGKCDELWVFGDALSNGMTQELAEAMWRGMPIKYFDSQGNEVAK
jgi:hypothetical protein